MNQKTRNQKIDIASWSAIILGVVLGLLLRRVKFGFLVGLALGIIVVYLFSRKRN
jgi:NhaP-type Na+/H+ or K+/H+ antiporter